MNLIVLFALSRESRPFLGRFPRRRPLRRAPCPAWFCETITGNCVVLESGVGPSRCETALEWLRVSETVREGDEIIGAGFAGALREGQRIGDVLQPSEVIDSSGQVWATESKGRQRLLSLPRMIGEPEEKRHLGALHDCVAVDMESASLARFCAEYGYRFRCIRAISDEVTMPLSPALLRLLNGSQPSPWKILVNVCRRPRLLVELLRLARNTGIAARNLADIIEKYVVLEGCRPLPEQSIRKPFRATGE